MRKVSALLCFCTLWCCGAKAFAADKFQIQVVETSGSITISKLGGSVTASAKVILPNGITPTSSVLQQMEIARKSIRVLQRKCAQMRQHAQLLAMTPSVQLVMLGASLPLARETISR